VTAIDWSSTGVRVSSSAGTVEAGAVIVTVPTSVLASGAIRFTPALPAAWRESAENLPLGVANKVFFVLHEDCCDADQARHFIGRTDTSRTCSYLLFPAEQRLLCAYFGGDLSMELESRGELEAFAREDLRNIFGPKFANCLRAARATAWGTDKYALGSYSAAKPGHAEARSQLSRPVSPQLLFAGEACSKEYYGTLHGAWLSGTAAAAQLLPGSERLLG
jgi:monoamine oxidase